MKNLKKTQIVRRAFNKDELQESLLAHYRFLQYAGIPVYSYNDLSRFLTTNSMDVRWIMPFASFAGKVFEYIAGIIYDDAHKHVSEWEVTYSTTDNYNCVVKVQRVAALAQLYLVKLEIEVTQQRQEDTLRKTSEFQALA